MHARDLSPDQKTLIESLPGRRVLEDEEIIVRANSPVPPDKRRKELAAELSRYFAEVDARRKHGSRSKPKKSSRRRSEVFVQATVRASENSPRHYDPGPGQRTCKRTCPRVARPHRGLCSKNRDFFEEPARVWLKAKGIRVVDDVTLIGLLRI